MKFLCDEMLGRLGRWLRVAGYDTAIATQVNAFTDRELLQQAVVENRILITRDRHFCEIKGKHAHIIFLHANTLDECIVELSKQLPIDWLKQPFSRCLICNTFLQKLSDPANPTLFPDLSKQLREHHEFWFCSHCQKVYWQGSHTTRMLQQLQHWQHR